MFGCVPCERRDISVWWSNLSTLSGGSTWYSHRLPAARPGLGMCLDDDSTSWPPSFPFLPPVQITLPQISTIWSAKRTVPGHMQCPD